MKTRIFSFVLALLVSAISPSLFAVESTDAATSTTAPAASGTTGANAATTTTSTAPAADAASAKPKVALIIVLQQLQKAGYIVKSADYSKDDGLYKVEAVDRHGEKQSLEVNANTGLTPDQKKAPHELTIVQAIKKLDKNGRVVAIAIDSDAYKATVLDNKGNQQDYTVDAKTGKVTQ